MRKVSCLLIAWLGLFFYKSSAAPVCVEKDGGTALVVIDMQSYFAERNGKNLQAFVETSSGNDQLPANRAKVAQLIKEEILAINYAKQANIPIVFIEYDRHGETRSDLKAAVGAYHEVRYFKKNTDGMFDVNNQFRDELNAYLEKMRLKTLIITGANGGACVLESIKGALENGCSVVAYNQGIADFNYREFIYPYAGIYNIKPVCSTCKFSEVSSLDGVIVPLNEIKTLNVDTTPPPNGSEATQ